MVLTPFLDGLFGMPMEFIGVAIGLIVSVLVLMLLAFFGRLEGPVMGWMAVILCVMNFILFAWPLWPIAVVGVTALWQMVVPTQTQLFSSGRIDNSELLPIMLMVISAVIILGFWPAIVTPAIFLLVGFMLYSTAKGSGRPT